MLNIKTAICRCEVHSDAGAAGRNKYPRSILPVIASPVGVNAEIVEHGVNGFLASTETEWTEALRTLLSDAAVRKRMGEAGRHKVERDYSLQVWGPRVAQMLRDVDSQGGRI